MNIRHETLWIVTKANKNSQSADILFHATFEELEMQYKGGLTTDQIVGIYTEVDEAEIVAINQLKQVQS